MAASFLSATHQEVLALSHAQDVNNEQIRQELDHALTSILSQVHADSQNNAQLSHDALYRSLAARVDAGIQHIGSIGQDVETKARGAAASRVSDMVTSSREQMSGQLNKVLNERLHADIQRALVPVEQRAIQAAQDRATVVVTDSEKVLREQIDRAIADRLSDEVNSAVTATHQAVEDRAIVVVQDRVALALQQTENAIRARLSQAAADGVRTHVSSTLTDSQRSLEDRAIVVAKGHVKEAVKQMEDDLRDRLGKLLTDGVHMQLSAGIVKSQLAVEDRAIVVAERRVAIAVKESEEELRRRLEAYGAGRLDDGVSNAVGEVKSLTTDRAIAVAEDLLKTLAADTRRDIEDSIKQRVDDTLANAAATIQQGVEERALVAVQERALVVVQAKVIAAIRELAVAAVREHAQSQDTIGASAATSYADTSSASDNGQAIIDEILAREINVLANGQGLNQLDTHSRGEVTWRLTQQLIDLSVDDRVNSRVDTLLGSTVEDIKNEAIAAVKRYEEIGKSIAQRRCDQALERLERHVHTALQDAKRDSLNAATSAARFNSTKAVEEAEQRLVQLHKILLRELQIQVGATPTAVAGVVARNANMEVGSIRSDRAPSLNTEPQSSGSVRLQASAKAVSTPTPSSSGSTAASSGVNPCMTPPHPTQVGEIEIEIGGVRILARTGQQNPTTEIPTPAAPSSSTQVSERILSLENKLHESLHETVTQAKLRALADIEAAVQESKERAALQAAMQSALTKMQMRMNEAAANSATENHADLSASEKCRLREIQRSFED